MNNDLQQCDRYEFIVKEKLDPAWSEWLGGLTIQNNPQGTRISGLVADQAALHGVISCLRDLNLTIIIVRKLENEVADGQHSILHG